MARTATAKSTPVDVPPAEPKRRGRPTGKVKGKVSFDSNGEMEVEIPIGTQFRLFAIDTGDITGKMHRQLRSSVDLIPETLDQMVLYLRDQESKMPKMDVPTRMLLSAILEHIRERADLRSLIESLSLHMQSTGDPLN